MVQFNDYIAYVYGVVTNKSVLQGYYNVVVVFIVV